METLEIKRKIAGKTEAVDASGAEMKEIMRLRFVLDRANRFPGLLSSRETLKLSRKLADLERRAHKPSV